MQGISSENKFYLTEINFKLTQNKFFNGYNNIQVTKGVL